MEHFDFDAVAFIPKRNIIFHGFGIYGNTESKDVLYKVCWNINGEDSEEHEIQKFAADMCPEKKWHQISLKELGVKPIKVAEDTKIHIKVKVTVDDMEIRRCYYGCDDYTKKY